MKSSTTTKNRSPVILLFGPTAVGKTELLSELFENKGEIISADSMQVYRGTDIGSAKPSPELIKRLPHHLLDILDINEQFTTGDFVRMADIAVPGILSRNRVPVISGGTAFYFKNFLYGLPPLPEVQPEWRNRLNREADKNGLINLYHQLEKADPETAARLPVTDRSRIIRALEVYYGTGKRLSEFPLPNKIRERYCYLVIGLFREKEELNQRINERVSQMFRRGLFNEIKNLLKWRHLLRFKYPEGMPIRQ